MIVQEDGHEHSQSKMRTVERFESRKVEGIFAFKNGGRFMREKQDIAEIDDIVSLHDAQDTFLKAGEDSINSSLNWELNPETSKLEESK